MYTLNVNSNTILRIIIPTKVSLNFIAKKNKKITLIIRFKNNFVENIIIFFIIIIRIVMHLKFFKVMFFTLCN